MRKLFCLIIVCILASVFVSVSDVSALSKKKILRTQWFGNGMMKMYSPTGDFLGAATGAGGIMLINETSGGEIELTGYYALNFNTMNLEGEVVVVGSHGEMTVSEVIYQNDRLIGTQCEITIFPPGGGDPVFYYDGDCDAKIKFNSPKSFQGNVTFTDAQFSGLTAVIELSGTLVGQTPASE